MGKKNRKKNQSAAAAGSVAEASPSDDTPVASPTEFSSDNLEVKSPKDLKEAPHDAQVDTETVRRHHARKVSEDILSEASSAEFQIKWLQNNLGADSQGESKLDILDKEVAIRGRKSVVAAMGVEQIILENAQRDVNVTVATQFASEEQERRTRDLLENTSADPAAEPASERAKQQRARQLSNAVITEAEDEQFQLQWLQRNIGESGSERLTALEDKVESSRRHSMLDSVQLLQRFVEEPHIESAPNMKIEVLGAAPMVSPGRAAEPYEDSTATTVSSDGLHTEAPAVAESEAHISASDVTNADTNPAVAEPAESAADEPVSAEPAAVEPVSAEPVSAEPICAEPAAVEPATSATGEHQEGTMMPASVSSETQEAAATALQLLQVHSEVLLSDSPIQVHTEVPEESIAASVIDVQPSLVDDEPIRSVAEARASLKESEAAQLNLSDSPISATSPSSAVFDRPQSAQTRPASAVPSKSVSRLTSSAGRPQSASPKTATLDKKSATTPVSKIPNTRKSTLTKPASASDTSARLESTGDSGAALSVEDMEQLIIELNKACSNNLGKVPKTMADKLHKFAKLIHPVVEAENPSFVHSQTPVNTPIKGPKKTASGDAAVAMAKVELAELLPTFVDISSAADSLSAAAEMVSAKLLSDLRGMKKAAAGVEDVVAAVMSLIATIGDVVELDSRGKIRDKTWAALQRGLARTAPLLNAVRRFQSVADTGKLPEINIREARLHLEKAHAYRSSFASSESVTAMHEWAKTALAYALLRKQTPVTIQDHVAAIQSAVGKRSTSPSRFGMSHMAENRSSSPSRAVPSRAVVSSPAAAKGLSALKTPSRIPTKTATPTRPSTADSASDSVRASARSSVRPATATPRTPSTAAVGSRVTAASTTPRKAATPRAAVAASSPPAEVASPTRAKSAPRIRSPVTPGTSLVASRLAASKIPSPKIEGNGNATLVDSPRKTPVRSTSAPRTREPSASPRPTTPGRSPRRPVANPELFKNLDLERWRNELEKTKKEIQDLRRQEAIAYWTREREYKAKTTKEQQEEELEYMKFQQEMELAFRERMMKKREQQREAERQVLNESLDFKHQVKEMNAEAERQFILESLRQSNSDADWQEQLRRIRMEEKRDSLKETKDSLEEVREIKQQQERERLAVESEERAFELTMEYKFKHEELLREKQRLELSLQSVSNLPPV
eukprot:GILK01004378.1.p1 GENE.GILK01004378.1~~GILK01004378.1.p1  ORF type:complete len:1195 (-),score=246.75 GILK01004378.1:243-3827(-)